MEILGEIQIQIVEGKLKHVVTSEFIGVLNSRAWFPFRSKSFCY